MSQIKKALVFIVFLFLTSFVYAQDYALFSGKFYELKEGQEKIEFEFYNGTYNICENEGKATPILIVNNANIDNKYALNVVGANWINLNVREFSLPKKQSGVIFLELNPNINTNGKYNIKINGVSSVGNVKRDLTIDINVEKCYSLSVELEEEEDKVCGGIKKQYLGKITNTGKQENDVELIVNGPNWINVDENIFSVDANDGEIFELDADVPANAKGIFNVFVTAIVKNLPLTKSEKELSIEVVPKYDCYKAEIIADTRITNRYLNTYIPIKVRNSGIKQAEYNISLEAPNWITLEPKKLILNPEQLGNLNLNINPDAKIPEGTYPAKIYVKLEGTTYSKNIDVVLNKNQFLKGLKSFLVFYQYYIYTILVILIILLTFRWQISNKIKTAYKNYKIRHARLKALKAARKAKKEKKLKLEKFQ